MIGQVAHPREGCHVHPCQMRLAFRHLARKDMRLQKTQEIAHPADFAEARRATKRRERHRRAAKEHHDHPRRADGGELRDPLESVGRHEDRHRRQRQRERDGPRARGIPLQLHRQAKHLLDGSCGDCRHRRRVADRGDAPRRVVGALEPGSGRLAQIGEERKARIDGYRRRAERIHARGEQIAHDKADEQLLGPHAPGHEQCADHEFRRGDVLAAVDAEEIPKSRQPRLRHRTLLRRDAKRQLVYLQS